VPRASTQAFRTLIAPRCAWRTSIDSPASSVPQAAERTSFRRSERIAAAKGRLAAGAGERRAANEQKNPKKSLRLKPRVLNDENASPNTPAPARRRTSIDSPASSIAQVPETTSTRRSPRDAAAKDRPKRATSAETGARVAPSAARAPVVRAAPAAPRARVAEGHAGQDPEFVLTHGAARKKVKEYEPFMQDALKGMVQKKLKRGIKKYVVVAKKDENGKLTVNEEWLGVPLERNCELPSDTGSGAVGVALCTYNAGTTNGARGTLGKTPFALQKAGFPANLSMRFLMRTIPMLVWHLNRRALLPRFRGWRKFADAYGKRFGMFDLVSIALPKVSGVTIDLMKFMKGKDIKKFKGWVLATADYFERFLGFCGGASKARAIINASGMTASTNPWIFFLCELKAFEPKHAVVAYLQSTVDEEFIMPHASALIDGRINVGFEKLLRGDDALTQILSAIFVDEKNGPSLLVRACYDWKRDRKNASEAVDAFERKEKEQMRKATAEAEKAARAARAKAYKARKSAYDKAQYAIPEVKARKLANDKVRRADPKAKARKSAKQKARRADPEAKARTAANGKVRRADPEAKARKSANDKARRADPEAKARKSAYDKARNAKPEVKARKSANGKVRRADPEAKARKSAYNRAWYAKRKVKTGKAARVKARKANRR
jgi:hypothetical protein